MKKRLFSLLLALCMALTLLPTTVWAAEDPVAILAWIEEGQAKTADLDASDLPGCCFRLWNDDVVPSVARTDAATLTLLKDVRLEEPLRLGYADIALDGQGATLSRGFGGSYDGAPPVMCDDGNHRLVNVTLDGTYCGEEEPTSPPTVVDVRDGSSITLGSGTSIVNGGQPPATEPDCYIPAKGGAIDLDPGGTLRLEDGCSITGNRGQQAGGVYAEVGSRVEFPAQTARGGGEGVTIQNNTVGRRPSNLVLLTTERRGTDDSSFVPIQVSRSLAGSSIGVSRLAWSSADYKFVTAPGVVAQGNGYTLDQDDLAAFFSDDPLHGLSLDVEHNAIVLGDLPPHTHAMSVDCEATGGDQLTYKPLTVNDAGKLCVDGAALTPSSYGNYTLGGGNYYLPGDIALDDSIIYIQDAAGAPTNLCLNGHTLDLGEGYLYIQSTTGQSKGVLNLCDCSTAESGLITSAYSNDIYAVIFSQNSFSLYGGTVRSTGANTPTLYLNAGAANLCGGKVVSDHGTGLFVEAWQAKGLVLSGNVTIRGEADQGDILLYSPSSDWAKGHITLAGSLTKPAAPWRVAVDEPQAEAMPLLEGWATHMADADFSDYFQIATKGLFIDQLENGDLALDVCAITQQPAAENRYTVAAKGASTYQWYPAQMVTEDVTTENATAYSSDYGTATYDPAAKLWTGVGSSFTRYFTIHLLKGETVTVKPNATLSSRAGVCLQPEPYEYSYLVELRGNQANEAGEYLLTAPVERDYTFIYESNDRAVGADTTFSAKVTRPKLGGAVAGQTAPALTATQAGDYLCQVTWPGDTKQNSNIVTYTPPHKHAMSVGCETTGDDLVTFDKALTSRDGKLYVDGVEVPSEPINMSGVDMTQYQLPSGHYYLPEDVTLADKSYLFLGGDAAVDVDLCLNGHVLDLGGSHSRMNVAGSAQLRVCDCGDGGAVRGAYTSNERLGAMVNVTGALELYGGTVENTATPGENQQARAVALFMGAATLYGGQVTAGHDAALQYDASAVEDGGLTLYDGVTLRGGADSAEVWLSDVFGYGDDPVLAIAQPLTAPETPWRLASSKAQTLTDGWKDHMADKDFSDYFTCMDQGRFIEKTGSGELTLADYAITAQPSKANGYTVTANGAPSYQWHSVAVEALTDENTVDGGYASAYADGKWTAGRDTFGELGYFVVDLRKGDILTVTVEDGTIFSEDGLCFIPSASGDEIYQPFQSGKTVYTFTAPYDFPYALEYRSDAGHPASVLSATVATPGAAVSGQTAKTLTADEEGTYLCRVTWPDGTTLNSDVVAYTPPAHVHDWVTAWSKNDTHHWHECAADNCDVTDNSGKDGYGEHIYDDDQDATCNTCGHTRAIAPPVDPDPPTPDQGEAKGEVVVKGDTPPVTVDEDALKDLAGEVSDGDTVTVKLTVEKQEAPADQDDIQAVVTGNKSDVLYLDLSLLKQVNDEEPTPITDTGDKVLEIAVPYDFTGKRNVTVYRKHGEQDVEKLTALSARPTENFTDGAFFADSANGVVYIYAGKFSTYAIGYTKQSASSPSGGRRPAREETPAWPFTDVAATDAFYESVKYVYEKGWMLGTSDATFSPQGELTRAMLATVLYRSAGSPKVEGKPQFEDTVADTWYSDAIVWAAQTQVLRGYGNGKFGPNDPVSREMLNMVTARQQGKDPVWTGDPALAAPATRAEVAATLMEQGEKVK